MKRRKRRTLQRCAGMAMALMCMLCCASPAFASAPDDYFPGDTDGTEMQLMQPVQLEIRLGQEWVGAQFTLVTDVGQYPGTITVAQDGMLRMEIGGSQSYVLKLVGMGDALPDGEATPEPESTPAEGETEGTPAEEGASDEEAGEADAVGGFPIFPIVLFGAGIVIAGGVLIVMKVLAKRQASSDDEDDDDDESEYEDEEDDD